MARLQIAINEIRATRKYTAALLDATDSALWFRQPAGGVTHIAWQVGHLAMAEYRLTLQRIRGPRASDEALISADFLQSFGRDSEPSPDARCYPSIEEIRRVFDAVHQQALAELPTLADEELDNPPLAPHKLFSTKFGSLMYAGRHEMLHAGQIGLLRRLLGLPSVW